ncbi:MAG: helix-turn-helix domain-containing protein [Treponema sp.]|nr:helix-turn-helix domain-containing protein [Treponema sp.]
MYRVLIVDDEEPVLDSYEYMLANHPDNDAGGGFFPAARARTGYEALTMIRETTPDLVFMDINIPGMSGLEVISQVHEKFPRIVFVLSTAYERFDLAQRAIPLGVFEYLVKPVSKRTFFSTLDRVREYFGKREREEGSAPADASVFLNETITEPLSETEWENCRERFSLPSDKGLIGIIEIDERGRSLSSVLEKLLLRYSILSDTGENRSIFLVSGEMGRETLADQVAAAGDSLAGVSWRFGIGGLCRGTELYRSREEALEELRSKAAGPDAGLTARLRIARLRSRIGIADEGEMKKLFALIEEDAFAASGGFTRTKAEMAGLFTLLVDDIYGAWSGGAETFCPINPAAEISALENPAAWKAWSKPVFEKLLAEASRRRSGNFPLPLLKAIAFIQEHYAEPLQLGSAAEAAQVTPAYLSRLFSDQLKTSFVDYLTEYRIERSEKLIRESGMSIKEISFMVGYQDPNYFSKIYRKVRGTSPSEFAERASRHLQ